MRQLVKIRVSVVGFIIYITTLLACQSTITPDLTISNINVIDIVNGNVIEGQDVFIVADRIHKIKNHNTTDGRLGNTVEGTDKYLIPGLWDMHTHLRTFNPEEVLPLFILHGIIGIRDLGLTDFELIKQWQQEIDSGLIIGPRIRSSGCIIEGLAPAFGNSLIVENVEQVKPVVDSLINEGVDFIKLYDTIDKDIYEAIIEYCNSVNILTVGHIPPSINQIKASNIGLTSIEHLSGLDNTLHKYYSDEDLDMLINILKENETYQCPTLTSYRFLADFDISKKDRNRFLDSIANDVRLELAPNYYKGWWTRISNNNIVSKKYKNKAKELSFYCEIVQKLSEKGVKILAGTDVPNPFLLPGFSLHEELIMLNESGLSNSEVLKTATLYPAQYFHKSSFTGTVEENSIADLVILNDNPLMDIRNTQKINSVVFNGVLYSASSLDEIRANLRKTKNKSNTKDFDQYIYMKIQKEGVKSIIKNYEIPQNNNEYKIEKHHLLRLAEVLSSAHKIEEAIEVLKWNIKIYPGYDKSYNQLGINYLDVGDTLNAERSFTIAKKLTATDSSSN